MSDTLSTSKISPVAFLVAGAFFMENLDATVITPALPAMARSFHALPVDLNIGVSAYMMALAVFIPISGWMVDRFGARVIFALAVCLFTGSSLFCGLTNSLWQFVVLRILQGIGGAMMVPVGRLVVLRKTPKDQLIHAIAVLTWPALVSPVLGPPIGGFITTFASWRWIFYLNLPLGVMAFLAALRMIPAEPALVRRSFDWPGFALTGGALLAIMSAIEAATRTDTNWLMAAGLAVGGILLLVLALRHLKRANSPMIDLSTLSVPTFAATVWGGSLFRMGVSAVPFLLPLMFQLGFGMNAFHAGLLVIAVFAGNIGMKPFTTQILRKFGFRQVLIGNGLLNFIAIGACAFLGQHSVILTLIVLFISGMTRSMQFTALNTLAFADVPQPQMSAANTLFSTVFQLAMGLGVALGGGAFHAGEWLMRSMGMAAGPDIGFRIAFIVVALVSAAGLFDTLKLTKDAGDSVARKMTAKS